ncbi:S1 family peptidase [Salinibaculum rarum]|uniref:S1 family peptidase n=1 Tax=Salinibaculum rarum TaxID=3058903 RepID=UPI00265F63D4|nr:serine protease [Salinibaculum sp. KK48]
MTQARDVGLEARDAVVWLYHNNVGKEDIMGGIGTGWFIDDTHIVTNGHIIDQNNEEDGSFRAITINNTSHELEVLDYVYNINPTRDVALLKLKDGSAPHALTLGDTNSLEEGQPLIQIGHPATIGNWLIALGTYTGRSPGINSNSLTTEMPSYSGNSGSPLLTLDGDVVGLHYASTSENYAGDPPTPIDEDVDEARVYTELPYQKRKSAVAEPIEDVTSHLSDWRN